MLCGTNFGLNYFVVPKLLPAGVFLVRELPRVWPIVLKNITRLILNWKVMTPSLNQTPKTWLTLTLCKNIYTNFQKRVKFQEPLKNFESRFPGKLEAILGSVSQSFAGQSLYPTVLDAASAYFYKINCLHPFENGNKRLCILYTDAFLYFHDLELQLSHRQMYDLALFVAQSRIKYRLSQEDLHVLCRLIIADYTKKRNQSLVSAIGQLLPKGLKVPELKISRSKI